MDTEMDKESFLMELGLIRIEKLLEILELLPLEVVESLLEEIKSEDGANIGVESRGPESDMTEESIARILNEASCMMKPQDDTHSNEDSKSPNHPQENAESPLGRENSQTRRLKKYENDDIPQEQVVRIYQEELAKSMGKRLEDQNFPGLVFPHFLSGGSEDVRLAMDAYHPELAKLNQSAGGLPHPLAALHAQNLSAVQNSIAQDLSLPKQVKREKASNEDEKKDDDRHGGSAFSLVRPKVEPDFLEFFGEEGANIGLESRGPESDMTEESIARILNEASCMMKPQDDTHSNEDSKSPNHPQENAESRLGRENSQTRRLKKYENDDIPQEQIVRIYQEELAKSMGKRLEDQNFPGLVCPHFLSGGSEDVRLAMDAYHPELAKLNQSAGGLPHPLAALHAQNLSAVQNSIAQDLSLPKKVKREKSSNEDEKKDDDRHGGSAFSLVRPKVEPDFLEFFGEEGANIGLESRGPESNMTEESIARILNEASCMMKPQDDTHSNEDSKSPNHPQEAVKIPKLDA